MSIDIIRFEYIAEYFRGEPTIAEKTLHCLFMEPTTDDLSKLLPYYSVHIYVNDHLIWDYNIQLSEFIRMLQPGTTITEPFLAFHDWYITEELPIEVSNNGTFIYWRGSFIEHHMMPCGSDRECFKCIENKMTTCIYREKLTQDIDCKYSEFTFVAYDFQWQLIKLAKSIVAAHNLMSLAMGGELSEDEQEKIIEENQNKWGNNFDENDWNDYQDLVFNAKEFLQMQPINFPDYRIEQLKKLDEEEKELQILVSEARKERIAQVDKIIAAQKQALLPKLYGENDTLPPQEEIRGSCNYEFLQILHAGIKKGKLVQIKYVNNFDECNVRKIMPEKLIFTHNKWYCIAFCHLRNEARIFRVNAILQCKLTRTSDKFHGVFQDFLDGKIDFLIPEKEYIKNPDKK